MSRHSRNKCQRHHVEEVKPSGGRVYDVEVRARAEQGAVCACEVTVETLARTCERSHGKLKLLAASRSGQDCV